jgi:hypothetical protein
LFLFKKGNETFSLKIVYLYLTQVDCYELRVLRQWTTIFFSVYRRMSPYTTRRYTIVIRSHVNRRISPCTVVYDRACSTWVSSFMYWYSLLLKYQHVKIIMTSKLVFILFLFSFNTSWRSSKFIADILKIEKYEYNGDLKYIHVCHCRLWRGSIVDLFFSISYFFHNSRRKKDDWSVKWFLLYSSTSR